MQFSETYCIFVTQSFEGSKKVKVGLPLRHVRGAALLPRPAASPWTCRPTGDAVVQTVSLKN
jgi:hypothetical protein